MGGLEGLQGCRPGPSEGWRTGGLKLEVCSTSTQTLSQSQNFMWELPELEFFRVEPNSCPFLIESIRRSSQVISMDQ